MFTNLSFWLQFIKKIIYVIFIVTYHLDCLLGRIFVFSLSFLFPLEVLSGLLEKDGWFDLDVSGHFPKIHIHLTVSMYFYSISSTSLW